MTGRGKRGGIPPSLWRRPCSWDTPITAAFPIAEQWKAGYKKQGIEGYCDSIKGAGNTSCWVCAQALAGGRYRHYIGY